MTLGNVIRHTDRKGLVATFIYDPIGRRTGAAYADGATTSFSFDAAGRLIQASDSVGGTILNTYDLLDRLVAQATGLGTISYQYDALGRRTRMEAPDQAPVTYGYDAASRLTTITQASQVVSLAYDAAGRRARLTLPNGVSTEYQYDTASRVTALIYRNALGPLGDLTYQYDAAGNRLRVGGSFARTLLPDAVASATYDAANRLITFASISASYDANGNLISADDPSGTTTLSWDSRQRLIAVSLPTLTGRFTYDALGRRVTRALNDQFTQFVYDGFDIVQELATSASTAYLRSLVLDEPFANSLSEYYVSDAQGSILGLTDPSGALTTRYVYTAFGETQGEGLSSPNPFRYTGREQEQGTGFYYLRARYYAPRLHRFVSEDPLGLLAGELNPHTYAANNPIVFVDPFGLTPFDWLDFWSEFSAGFGDTVTFGGTSYIRDLWEDAFGLPDTVDPNSSPYLAGQIGGLAWDAAFGALAGARLLGWNTKLAIHGAHHTLGRFGKLSHIQVNWWRTGVKGSGAGRSIHIPLPWK